MFSRHSWLDFVFDNPFIYSCVDSFFFSARLPSLLFCAFDIPMTSVVDPDPLGYALIWLSWIRIRIGNANLDPEARKIGQH